MITVLLSAYNEANNPFFWETIKTIKGLREKGIEVETFVGVTPGGDQTLELLNQQNVPYVEVISTKRSERYNRAFELAQSKKDAWIVLNHPRSILTPEAFITLTQLSESHKWGAFTHKFDISHPLLSFTSWWSNHVRGDLKKIFYLDHCLFVRKEIFEKVGGFPDKEIFEDTLLSMRLSALHAPVRLPQLSTTSAIRFQKNGVWNQALKNQILKCRFLLNDSDENMNKDYERGVDLNSDGRK